MAWFFLTSAILLEIAGTVSMKLSDGFSKWIPSALMLLFYLLAFICLSFSFRTISVSIAYAIWSGVGTAAIAIIGYFIFQESLTVTKVTAILLIIIGVVLLNIGGDSKTQLEVSSQNDVAVGDE
ncbi:small multidrug resistance protein [Ammoniphilus oxalaticus]|uniref:Small multidrug resistance protein n=1 Tax=Ammoniphilus oxalaticus TaxID=66863 RepID=A0A419SNP6_9BACL|nr:multidrug efflux SMR transporter [Ammoniphilus oxalaticus]RKD25887.1 small multidrug resistance protein [Ammoniphilus oxalaticus]